MKLCIVRHGLAEVGADSDQQRPLREEGAEQARLAGLWLADAALQSPLIVSSPFVRAQQTAEAIASSLAQEVRFSDHLTPSSSPQQLLGEVSNLQQDVVLVSHLPLVGRLAALLVEGQVFDQPWSPAECWLLEGDVFAAACMTVTQVWYPELARS